MEHNGSREQLRVGTPASYTILLCTRNGASFLDIQLRSLAEQTAPVVNLHVSDDGSTDETLTILKRWERSWTKGAFRIEQGPQRGFAENFRSLVLRASDDDYLAFCDQDDLWHPDKLESASDALRGLFQTPALYGGRSVLVDKHGQQIGFSPHFKRPPGFGNALVQSLAAGNTMVLNRSGFEVLRESAHRTDFLMHDWWAYLLISGSGGHIHFDERPHIDYRQHEGNVLGGRVALARRPQRLLELWNGKYVKWNAANLQSLDACRDLLSDPALELVEKFRRIRQRHGAAAVLELRSSGLYRQTGRGDMALALAAFFHRL